MVLLHVLIHVSLVEYFVSHPVVNGSTDLSSLLMDSYKWNEDAQIEDNINLEDLSKAKANLFILVWSWLQDLLLLGDGGLSLWLLLRLLSRRSYICVVNSWFNCLSVFLSH